MVNPVVRTVLGTQVIADGNELQIGDAVMQGDWEKWTGQNSQASKAQVTMGLEKERYSPSMDRGKAGPLLVRC